MRALAIVCALVLAPAAADAAKAKGKAPPKTKTRAPPAKAPPPAPPVAAPAPPPKPTLLVLDFQPERGVDAALVTAIHGLFLSQVDALGKYSVMSKQDLKTLLGLQAERELLGCGDDKCIVDIAGGLGARFVVAGSLGRVGTQAVLNARLLDATKGTVEARVTEMSPSDKEDALIGATKNAVRMLFASPEERKAMAPSAPPAPEPAPTAPPPAAEPEPSLLASPWFWTVAGVLVIGAGAGGYFLLSSPLPEAPLGVVVLDAP